MNGPGSKILVLIIGSSENGKLYRLIDLAGCKGHAGWSCHRDGYDELVWP